MSDSTINYRMSTLSDQLNQDLDPADFFQSFLMKITDNLQKGTLADVPIMIVYWLLKDAVHDKEKKEILAREFRLTRPENLNDLKTCFISAMHADTS